jgi:stage V sporulation protein AC
VKLKKNREITNQEYQEYVDNLSPKPTFLKNCIHAFVVGGLICVIGQFISEFWMNFVGYDKLTSSSLTSITLVFLGAFFTGLGVYDLLGKRAGAGSIVPITGFANSIVSPAMEHRQEGFVLGVSANLFKIAGPVLVYGIGSSILCGIIYFVMLKINII